MSKGPDFFLANWFAKLSEIAYWTDYKKAEAHLQNRGFAAPIFFDTSLRHTGDTQCMVVSSDNWTAFVFRGTQFSDGVDIDFNANFDLRYTNEWFSEEELVHVGYSNALDCIFPELVAYTEQISSPIYLVGHSMGGVLATLFARRWTKAEAVYSFGAPKPGNKKFWSALQTPVHRFVNSNDFAPHWPFRDPFCQGGEFWELNENGLVYPPRFQFMPMIFLDGYSEHAIELYMKRTELAAGSFGRGGYSG